MIHLVELILLILVLWIALSFHWGRMFLAALSILSLALCLVALTWLTLDGLWSTSWDWFYVLILPSIGLGLHILWTAYWVVLERCLEWLHKQIHLPPRHRHP